MLTEHFIASISDPHPSQKSQVAALKDAGIFVHEFLPQAGQRHVFKKSATEQGCLAVTESHIFAAQKGKAVVHVYSREKGNQEATVPFPERIGAIGVACNGTVLVLGTDGGRVILWEVCYAFSAALLWTMANLLKTCTGRQINTAQAHLQPVTALSISPDSNFLLTGSSDSNVHVWSLPALLSFSTSSSQRVPLHTLSSHRGALTALRAGHGTGAASIAISASNDKTAIVWDYKRNLALKTYLLGDAPLCLELDPADRAFYAGYSDGSVQLVDFYANIQDRGPAHPILNLKDAGTAIQPAPRTRWRANNQNLGATLSLALSWDTTTLISGHESGKICTWDPAKGVWSAPITTLTGPVTNLCFLPPTGFPTPQKRTFKIHTVVKPRRDLVDVNGSGSVPGNYTFTAQLTGRLPTERNEKATNGWFTDALTHPSFPSHMIESGLSELAAWHEQPPSSTSTSQGGVESADFMTFDGAADTSQVPALTLQQQNEQLQEQIAALQRLQQASFDQMAALRDERDQLVQRQNETDGAVIAAIGEKMRQADEEWEMLGMKGREKRIEAARGTRKGGEDGEEDENMQDDDEAD